MIEIFFAGAVTAMIGFWLGFFTSAFFLGAKERKERDDE